MENQNEVSSVSVEEVKPFKYSSLVYTLSILEMLFLLPILLGFNFGSDLNVLLKSIIFTIFVINIGVFFAKDRVKYNILSFIIIAMFVLSLIAILSTFFIVGGALSNG
ncbi:MAG: hypothetical protein WCI41_02820 [bacterium]